MYISNDVAERIKALAKNKHIPMKKLLSDIQLGFNTMSNMKTSMPKADNLAKIADYLDCSVDYLLGRIDTPNLNAPALPPAIKKYQLLPPDKQQSVDDVIDGLYEVVRQSRQQTDETADKSKEKQSAM